MYTYIDESVNKVTRTTTINNPEVQLSADQNDVIYNSAVKTLKQSGFTCDKAQAVAVQLKPGSASSATGASTVTPAAASMTGAADPSGA